jgi:hypothetical protein
MAVFDNDWLDARIAATAALIEAYETEALAISSGLKESYTLDTGQTRITVTRSNLSVLRNLISGLEERLTQYHTRRYGGVTHIVPGF